MTTAAQLAVEFRKAMKSCLQASALVEIDQRNASEPDKGVCHSHDFCDANQVMLDAMEVVGMDFDPEDQQQNSLIDAAWNIVKQEGFSK